MRNIDITKVPWSFGASYLAGLTVPDDAWHHNSPTRRTAKIILIENQLRRSRGQPVIDYINEEPSEALFLSLAKINPRRLLAWVAGGDLSPGLLARAVEAAGHIIGEHYADATDVLLRLLYSEIVVVQEATIYALCNRIGSDEQVRTAIEEKVRSTDTHPIVREIARLALEEASERQVT